MIYFIANENYHKFLALFDKKSCYEFVNLVIADGGKNKVFMYLSRHFDNI